MLALASITPPPSSGSPVKSIRKEKSQRKEKRRPSACGSSCRSACCLLGICGQCVVLADTWPTQHRKTGGIIIMSKQSGGRVRLQGYYYRYHRMLALALVVPFCPERTSLDPSHSLLEWQSSALLAVERNGQNFAL